MRPVSGPAELNQRMIESGKVEACLSANYFRYALRRDPTRDSADALRVRGDAQRPRVGRRAGRRVPRHREQRRLPAAQGGRAMKKTLHGGCSSRARAAPCWRCRSSSRWCRGAAGQTVTPPKRFIVLKSFSTQLVQEWYPRFTGNGYQLKDTKYAGSKADGTTLLTQKLVTGKNYTWAPLTDFQTSTGISGILGPALNPFLPKLTLIRGLDFLPTVNHNYGGLLGNFSSCTAATPCDADSLTDVPTIDQVMAYSPKVYPTTPGLRYLHISQGVTIRCRTRTSA